MELVEVTFAISNFGEVFVEEGSTIGAGGVLPFGLIGEESVGVFFPVALEAGGFGGGGSSGAVLMVVEEVVAIDDAELAVELLDGLIDARVKTGAGGALVVGVFDDKDGGIFAAFDVVADVAIVGVWCDVRCEIVIVEIGGFIVAVDNEESGDTDESDDCDNGDDADFTKTFAEMFHITPLCYNNYNMMREIWEKIRKWLVARISNVRVKMEGIRGRTNDVPARTEGAKVRAGVRTEKMVEQRIEKVEPRTMEELVEVMRRMPRNVLTSRDRKRIAAVMSFDERTVEELMVGREKMVFVGEDELLGPLTLDKLYKSGFTNFPVVDGRERVRGVIHTEALNALEIKKTDKAKKYMVEACYLHVGDSLKFVVEEIERTNSYYFLVLDKEERLAGFFTVYMLLKYLLG